MLYTRIPLLEQSKGKPLTGYFRIPKFVIDFEKFPVFQTDQATPGLTIRPTYTNNIIILSSSPGYTGSDNLPDMRNLPYPATFCSDGCLIFWASTKYT